MDALHGLTKEHLHIKGLKAIQRDIKCCSDCRGEVLSGQCRGLIKDLNQCKMCLQLKPCAQHRAFICFKWLIKEESVLTPTLSVYAYSASNVGLIMRHLCLVFLKCGSGKRKNILLSCKWQRRVICGLWNCLALCVTVWTNVREDSCSIQNCILF